MRITSISGFTAIIIDKLTKSQRKERREIQLLVDSIWNLSTFKLAHQMAFKVNANKIICSPCVVLSSYLVVPSVGQNPSRRTVSVCAAASVCLSIVCTLSSEPLSSWSATLISARSRSRIVFFRFSEGTARKDPCPCS